MCRWARLPRPRFLGQSPHLTPPRLACSSRCTVAESGPAPPLVSADRASEEKADRSANKERRRCSTRGKMVASKCRTKVISLGEGGGQRGRVEGKGYLSQRVLFGASTSRTVVSLRVPPSCRRCRQYTGCSTVGSADRPTSCFKNDGIASAAREANRPPHDVIGR